MNKENSLVLPNGVNSDQFHPVDNGKRESVKFLFVARLEPYKGVITLLEAWDGIDNHSDMELHIVGEGFMAKEIRKRKVEGLIYHGALGEHDLQQVYRMCDVFVYPTAMDSLPLVVLEALSCGLHVITSRILEGSYDDFKTMGALEYCDNRPDEFAKRMDESASNITEIRSSKKRIHEYVSANYDWKSITSRLYDFFEEVAK